MIKVHYQDDQDELRQACGGVMTRLIETERGVKSAASDLIDAGTLERYRPDKDHFLIHCIAMGDQETYGPNKNADGWPKEALERRHQTFVDCGHMFREHRNRDPKKKIGDIKYAAYDPGGMRRVELLMHGHKKKAADEYDQAKAGEELSFSMSARVPEDVCSICGHRAKSPASYCDHLKYGMLQYDPQHKKYAFAINPDPTFFDNSVVERPADRIARYLEYKFHDADMRKAASESGQVISGTEWAEFEGVSIPDAQDLTGPKAELLRKMAALEKEVAGFQQQDTQTSQKAAFALNCAPVAMTGDLSQKELSVMKEARPGTLFREMAKRGCVLPFPAFAAYINQSVIDSQDQDAVVKRASQMLPDVFGKMLGCGCSGDMVNMFDADNEFSAQCDPGRSDVINELMSRADDKFATDPEAVKNRVTLIIIKSGSNLDIDEHREACNAADKQQIKSASVDARAEVLAEAYAQYQLSAIQDIENIKGASFDEAQRLVLVGHNAHCVFG